MESWHAKAIQSLSRHISCGGLKAAAKAGPIQEDGGLDVKTYRNFMHYRHVTIGNVGHDRSPSLMRL